MNAFAVQIAPAAEADIAAAFDWYHDRNALVADAFRAAVFDVIERIGQAPLGRPADAQGLRFRVMHRFPFSVFYEVEARVVTILAVAHHRRAPGYWR